MKREDISYAVSNIGDRHIQEAAVQSKHSNRSTNIKARRLRPIFKSAIAAILAVCLIVGGVVMLSPHGNVVYAYAYGTEEEITTAGASMTTGTISDNGDIVGHPLMFFLSGEDIATVRFSCKNQLINFKDLTEKRNEFGNGRNFTVPYGESKSEYAFLVIDWIPIDIIHELAENAESTIATLPENLKEDMIVAEVTFANGKTTTKAIHIFLHDDGSIFATFDNYHISKEDTFVNRQDSEPIPRDILYKKAEITVSFYDAENNEVYAPALWYNFANVATIKVKWVGATPETVRMYYTPAGTDTIDETTLIGLKSPRNESVADGEISFAVAELDIPDISSLMGHLQIDLDYGATKVTSEIYNVIYDVYSGTDVY